MSSTRKPEIEGSSTASADKHLRFEQVVHLADKKLSATGKSVRVVAGTADLRHLLPKLNLSKDGDEEFILIRPYVHSMALYIRNVKGKIVFFIGDSQGWHWRFYPTRRIIDLIYHHFKDKDSLESAKIILPNTEVQPQAKQKGCDAISIATLAYCAEHGKKFSDQIAKMESISKEEKVKLDQGMSEYEIDPSFRENNVVCLAENELPEHYLNFIENYFVKSGEGNFWQAEGSKTIAPEFIDQIYKEFEALLQGVDFKDDEKSWTDLRKRQHLTTDYFVPDIENPTQYDIKIHRRDGKCILEVGFGSGKRGLENFLYDDSLMYSSDAYPKDVKAEKLKNIFSDLNLPTEVDSINHTLRISADNLEKLASALNLLATPGMQYQLYKKGMTQYFALSQFVYEAKETLQIEIAKNAETGGLFLNDVNAALKYYVEKSGKEKIFILQESIGIENEDLAKNVVDLLNAGYKKVIFSCTFDSSHQVAIIVDSETKKITVLDSEGKNYANKLRMSSGKQFDIPFFAGYSFEDKKPVVLQGPTDEWACGVHVVLNVLHELDDLPDRKTANIEEWLRKILRASAAARRNEFRKQNKEIVFRNIIANLIHINEAAQPNTEIKETPIIQIVRLVDDELKTTYWPSLDEFKAHSKYKEVQPTLAEPANELLAHVYALSELGIAKEDLEKILPDLIAMFTSPLANRDYFKKSENKAQKGMPLGVEISNVLGTEIESRLEDTKDIETKLAWLQEAYLSLMTAPDKWAELHKLIAPEMLSGVKTMVEESNQEAPDINIQNWIAYLFMSRLATTTTDLIKAEQAKEKRKESEAAMRASDSINKVVDHYIEEIKNQLGPEADKYESNLQLLKSYKKKIFIGDVKGWAEIAKSVELDTDLLQKIISDYQSPFTNTHFYMSLLKSLWRAQKSEMVGNLLLSPVKQASVSTTEPNVILKKIMEEGGFACIEALTFLPEGQQNDFLQQIVPDSGVSIGDVIKDYVEDIMQESFSNIQFRNLKDLHSFFVGIVLPKMEHNELFNYVIDRLPPHFLLQLLSTLEKDIQTYANLFKIVSLLPVEYRLDEAFKFKFLIQNGEDFAEILSVLPPHERFGFVVNHLDEVVDAQNEANFISTDKALRNIMRMLTPEEHQNLINLPFFAALLIDGGVLAETMRVLPERERLAFATKHQDKITSGKEIRKVVKHLLASDRWLFIQTYAHLIQDGSELVKLIKYVPDDEKLGFINKHSHLLTDVDDFIDMVNKLPSEDQHTFISQHEDKIENVEHLQQFINYYPLEQRWGLVSQFTSLDFSSQKIAYFLKNLPETKHVPFIKEVISDKDALVDLCRISLVLEKHLTWIIKELDKENSPLVIPARFDEFDVILQTLLKEERYNYALKHKDSIEGFQCLATVLYALLPDERTPFLNTCKFPYASSYELRSTLMLIDEKQRWPYLQDFMKTEQFESLIATQNFSVKHIVDLLIGTDQEEFRSQMTEIYQKSSSPRMWPSKKSDQQENKLISDNSTEVYSKKTSAETEPKQTINSNKTNFKNG